MSGNEDEFVSVLNKELTEYSEALEKLALNIGSDNTNESITEIKRILHAVKGVFGIIGEHYEELRVLSHKLEDLVEEKKNKEEITPIILSFSDNLSHVAKRVKENNMLEISYDDLFQEVKESLGIRVKLDQVFEVRVKITQSSNMKNSRLLTVLNQLQRLSSVEQTIPSKEELLGENEFDELYCVIRTLEDREKLASVLSKIPELETFAILAKALEVDPDKQAKEQIVPFAKDKIEVSLTKLDQIISLLEELILTENIFSKIDYSTLTSDEIDVLANYSKNILEIQDLIFEVRKLPADLILSKLPRLAYELAQKQNKKIQVFTRGTSIGVDRTIIEKLMDPLAVLVQNAIIHGIEPPQERKKKGKKEVGILNINVLQDENGIIIEVKDDGKGIDFTDLWKHAKDQELIPASKEFNPSEAKSFLFQPRFTTKKEADQYAGRGMGLYSVSEVIKELRGTVDLESQIDKGTTVVLRIPISKPIIPLIIGEINGITYGFPQTNIKQIKRISSSEKSQIIPVLNDDVFYLDGPQSEIPIINLVAKFSPKEKDSTGRSPQENAGKDYSILFYSVNQKEFGLLLNSILHLKDYPVNYNDPVLEFVPYSSGTTLLNPNEVITIINPEKFLVILSEA